jgi:hypothetical protein
MSAILDKEIKPVAVKARQYTTTNKGEIEALVGCDQIKVENGVFYVRTPSGWVECANNDYVICYAPTDYVAADPDADPDPIAEVPFVPGVVIEVTNGAGLTARYQDPA